LPELVSDNPVDEDWIYQFFNNCQDISNTEMQSLWAKLLANEVSQPGTFSLRTLSFVKNLSKEDADFFTSFCTFVWLDSTRDYTPIVLGTEHEHSKKAGLNYSVFSHLDSIGLITLNIALGYKFVELKEKEHLNYYGKNHILRIPDGINDINVGVALLTATGKELFPISGSKPSEEYRHLIVDCWRKKGLVVEEKK
jgi:hypothetical protein